MGYMLISREREKPWRIVQQEGVLVPRPTYPLDKKYKRGQQEGWHGKSMNLIVAPGCYVRGEVLVNVVCTNILHGILGKPSTHSDHLVFFFTQHTYVLYMALCLIGRYLHAVTYVSWRVSTCTQVPTYISVMSLREEPCIFLRIPIYIGIHKMYSVGIHIYIYRYTD